jgi:hypothetical protein
MNELQYIPRRLEATVAEALQELPMMFPSQAQRQAINPTSCQAS